MPIKTIKSISDFGIFKDFSAPPNLKDFRKFNLFYGWNGSGKSTISRIFHSLKMQRIHADHEGGKFTFQMRDGSEIKSENLMNTLLNVHVFNSDFIKNNLNFEEQKAKTILILSEEKIEERKKYKDLQEVIKTDSVAVEKAKLSYEKSSKAVSNSYTGIARNVKTLFESIQTSERRLLNYNSTKLKEFIQKQGPAISENSVLDESNVSIFRSSAKSTFKGDIQFNSPNINVEEIKNFVSRTFNTLKKDVIAEQLPRLLDNPDINQWVETGRTLHHKHSSTACEFCGAVLNRERLDQLSKHFSTDYQNLIVDLNGLLAEASQLKFNLTLPESISFYEESQAVAQEALSLIKDSQNNLNSEIEILSQKLQEKISNPFASISYESTLVGHIETAKTRLSNLKALVDQHNQKSTNFKGEVEQALHKLELHFVSQQVIQDNLFIKIGEEKALSKALEDEKSKLTKHKSEMEELEKILIDEVKGAEKFNDALFRFLGRKEIELKFNEKEKGYLLIRNGEKKPAINLSEGEKTAIAFVYFITKLLEGENKVTESVIVLDDPISSFDSNHLFHAYSFIKKELEQCRQLFILTHNFQFFRQIRDWFRAKDRDVKESDEDKLRSRFFVIECSLNPERVASIVNAPDTLIKYHSEYHYLFDRLNGFKNETALDLEKAFLVANISRKLLEGFLVFKFPRARNDFYNLMDLACKTTPERRDRVYQFINKYSHNQVIEGQDSSIDNMMGESDNVIGDIFEIVKTLDETHFSEMESLCAPIQGNA